MATLSACEDVDPDDGDDVPFLLVQFVGQGGDSGSSGSLVNIEASIGSLWDGKGQNPGRVGIAVYGGTFQNSLLWPEDAAEMATRTVGCVPLPDDPNDPALLQILANAALGQQASFVQVELDRVGSTPPIAEAGTISETADATLLSDGPIADATGTDGNGADVLSTDSATDGAVADGAPGDGAVGVASPAEDAGAGSTEEEGAFSTICPGTTVIKQRSLQLPPLLQLALPDAGSDGAASTATTSGADEDGSVEPASEGGEASASDAADAAVPEAGDGAPSGGSVDDGG